jgi:uncharacterized protein (DUF952 family)
MREKTPDLIFKIVDADLWKQAEALGHFDGSPVDARDGFIHFSTAAQVAATAAKHFAGVENLILVAVSTRALTLRWEPARGGELFPHLYGTLPTSSVTWVRAMPLGERGTHRIPL